MSAYKGSVYYFQSHVCDGSDLRCEGPIEDLYEIKSESSKFMPYAFRKKYRCLKTGVDFWIFSDGNCFRNGKDESCQMQHAGVE